MNPKQTGLFIQKKRKEKRMTQTELAELLQVTDKAISRWETGEGYPEISILPKLASLFGVTIDDILRGGEEKTATTSNLHVKPKFELFTTLSIFTIILGYLVGVTLIYVTENKYWALLPFFILGIAGLTWFFYQKYKFITNSDYDEEDKKCIKKQTRKIVIASLFVTYLLLPQFVFVAAFSFLGQVYYIEDTYLMFFNYLWVAFLFLVFFGGITLLVYYIMDYKNHLKNISSSLTIQLIYSMFAVLYVLIQFLYFNDHLFQDTFYIVIPFVAFFLVIPYAVLLLIDAKKYYFVAISNFTLSIGIIAGSIMHKARRLSYLDLGHGGYYITFYDILLLYLGFSLIGLGLSLWALIKHRTTEDKKSFITFSHRTVPYVFVIFIIFFIFVGRQETHVIGISAVIITLIWFIVEVILRLIHILKANK